MRKHSRSKLQRFKNCLNFEINTNHYKTKNSQLQIANHTTSIINNHKTQHKTGLNFYDKQFMSLTKLGKVKPIQISQSISARLKVTDDNLGNFKTSLHNKKITQIGFTQFTNTKSKKQHSHHNYCSNSKITINNSPQKSTTSNLFRTCESVSINQYQQSPQRQNPKQKYKQKRSTSECSISIAYENQLLGKKSKYPSLPGKKFLKITTIRDFFNNIKSTPFVEQKGNNGLLNDKVMQKIEEYSNFPCLSKQIVFSSLEKCLRTEKPLEQSKKYVDQTENIQSQYSTHAAVKLQRAKLKHKVLSNLKIKPYHIGCSRMQQTKNPEEQVMSQFNLKYVENPKQQKKEIAIHTKFKEEKQKLFDISGWCSQNNHQITDSFNTSFYH